MKKHLLTDWLEIEGNTQAILSDAVGVTQSAISQMAKAVRLNERTIYVVINGPSIELEEVRRRRRESAA